MIQLEKTASDALEKALSGQRISKEDAYELFLSPSIHSIGAAADSIRSKRCSDTVSYVVNRNINFTNICSGTCTFCAYRRGRGSEEAYLLSMEALMQKVGEAVKAGATEICMQGGLHPELDLEYYSKLLERIKAEHDIHLHAFSPMEVYHMADKSGLGIKETLKHLKEKGLDSMPGTAAEILDREVREVICPDKLSSEEWVRVIKTAHRLDIPTTATMLYGHIERPEHRINHLDILRKIQDETQGFTEFVPLSFIPYNTLLRRSYPQATGASGIEDLRVYAISRLFLDNFQNIQASWVKLGKKLAQTALYFGANDFGGTLMEESISKEAGQLVEMIDEAEMRALIAAAKRVPRRRDTLYNPLNLLPDTVPR